MPYSEREANRRAAAAAVAARQADADEAARRREVTGGQIDHLEAEAAALIPQALEVLAANGYKGIRQVTRKQKTRFGGYKNVSLGAYPLCTLTLISHGDRVEREIMLGSDSSIWPWDRNLAEYVKNVRRFEGVDSDTRFTSPSHEFYTIISLIKIVNGLKHLAGQPPAF